VADDADRAAKQQQEEIDRALATRRDRVGLLYTGRCHNCEENVDVPNRFCDSDCRWDWEKREGAGRAVGV